MKKNYYRILQVDISAEPEVIESAYRRLARKYHPDVDKAADATSRMKELNEAYEVLIDPAKRAAYDEARRTSVRPTDPEAPTRGQSSTTSSRSGGANAAKTRAAQPAAHARQSSIADVFDQLQLTSVRAGVTLIFFLLFFQNLEDVEIRFLFWDWQTDMAWALIVSALLGTVAVFLALTIRGPRRARTTSITRES